MNNFDENYSSGLHDRTLHEPLDENILIKANKAEEAAERCLQDIEPPNILEFTTRAFEDIVYNGENSIFVQENNKQWLTEMPHEIFDAAKYKLAQKDPELVLKLERSIPKLERNCPEIRILRQTIPYFQMKYEPELPPRINLQQPPGISQQLPSAAAVKRMSNPIKRQELSVGTIYSLAANGSRLEDTSQVYDYNKITITKPNNSDYADNPMHSYNPLTPNQSVGRNVSIY